MAVGTARKSETAMNRAPTIRTRTSPGSAVSIDEAARASSSASPGRRERMRRERTATSARKTSASAIAIGRVNRPTVWRLISLGASTLTAVNANEDTRPNAIPNQTARERAFFPRRPRPVAGMKRMTAPTASIVNSSVKVASLIC